MAEIKELKPSTKERPRPEKPAEIFDIEEARKKMASREATPNAPFTFPDTDSEQLIETASELIKKLFDESQSKEMVVERLHKLTAELEKKLKK